MSDYFEMLGLPRQFAVDLAALERRYLERSREVHPDRASGAAGQAMELNQAYRALKRDLPRAEHLLRLEGVTIGDNRPVAPALLAEVLELREELAEATAAGDRALLARLERDARDREKRELARLGGLFASLEALPAGSPERSARLDALVDQVIRLRYLARYREAFADDDDDAEREGAA
ncbi:MAG TPA: Fe-S protein assembly co-chaperone HscB [Kofleriaceae bacterium]|nr:Fe-S protein assembly co-chaperone HscB [Kofleriaceae bacterium]